MVLPCALVNSIGSEEAPAAVPEKGSEADPAEEGLNLGLMSF